MEEVRKQYYKERLAHYLKTYRSKNELTQAQVSEKLGYKTEFYRRIELQIEDRISNVFEYLDNFSKLEYKTLVDFVVYMEKLDITKYDRSLFEWEKKIIDAFNVLPQDVRRKFNSEYINKIDLDKFKKIINIANNLSKVDDTLFDLINILVEHSVNKKGSKSDILKNSENVINKI